MRGSLAFIYYVGPKLTDRWFYFHFYIHVAGCCQRSPRLSEGEKKDKKINNNKNKFRRRRVIIGKKRSQISPISIPISSPKRVNPLNPLPLPILVVVLVCWWVWGWGRRNWRCGIGRPLGMSSTALPSQVCLISLFLPCFFFWRGFGGKRCEFCAFGGL